MKKGLLAFFVVVCLCAVLVSCGQSETAEVKTVETTAEAAAEPKTEPVAESTPEPVAESTPEPVAESTPEPVAESAPETEAVSFEESGLLEEIESTITKNLSDYDPVIEYDGENSLINVKLTAPSGTVIGLLSGDQDVLQSWTVACDSFTSLAKSIYDYCMSNGYRVGCTIMILNDNNTENTLFAAINDTVIYNVVDE